MAAKMDAASGGGSRARGMGKLPREGVDLVYHSHGSGAPILLLAGGPGLDPRYLEPLAERLGAGQRVVLLHQRGTGESRSSRIERSTLSLEILVEDIELLREHLGFDRWVLLGHSWGGILAMAYAGAHPQRVRGLVLVGSGGIASGWVGPYTDNVLSRLTADERRAAAFWVEPERFRRDPQRALVEYTRVVAPAMVFEREAALPLIERTLGDGAFNVAVNRALATALPRYDFRAPLAQLSAPALVIQGRQDPVGESTARQIAQALPRSTLRFVERCGHWPFVERAAEFDAALAEFLAGLG